MTRDSQFSKPLAVVLIEDNPGDARLVQEALLRGPAMGSFTLEIFNRLTEGIQHLQKNPRDIVFLDLNLPDSFGVSTLKRLKEAVPDIPIVILSGVGTEDLALETVNAGAEDYLFKDNLTNHSLVIRTLRYAVGRHRITRQLRATEGHLRTVIESTSDGLVIVSPQGTIYFANPSAEGFLGAPAGDLLGKQFPFPIVSEREVESAINDGNGHRTILAIRATPTLWDGKPAFCASLRNVTERVRAEEALLETERKAARLKSEFLANMSHEIRPPMNGVIGMTSLLLETPLTADQRGFVETIRSSGELLLTLINDILDLSKIEAQKVHLEVTDFNFHSAIEETVDLFSQTVRTKACLLSCFISPTVPRTYRGDPWRLRQILSNLVSNAVKFTEEGFVNVRCDTFETEAGKFLKLEVIDTGIGIPKQTLAHLFQPFSQADSSTTRKYGGTGLGLAISKRLVELMNGEIHAESKERQGSRFWFTLPISALTSHAEVTQNTAESALAPIRLAISTSYPDLLPQLREMAALAGVRAEEVSCEAEWQHFRGDLAPKPAARLRIFDSFTGERGGIVLEVWNPDSLHPARAIPVKNPLKQSEFLKALRETLQDPNDSHLARERFSTPEPRLKLGSGMILVVEDNSVNQKIAVQMLARLGFRADVAANGYEALSLFGQVPYSAVLMDCQMPEMDGFEAARQIRQLEAGKSRVPMIAMTAHVLKEDRDRCLSAGMDDYIPKPVRIEDLEQVLARWRDHMPIPKVGHPTTTCLDRDLLHSYRSLTDESSPDFLSEVIDLFLENTPFLLVELHQALERGDRNMVGRLSHKLKGSAANLGVRGVADLSHQIELVAKDGDLEIAGQTFDDLREQFQTAKNELLRDWRNGSAL